MTQQKTTGLYFKSKLKHKLLLLLSHINIIFSHFWKDIFVPFCVLFFTVSIMEVFCQEI